MTTIPTLQGVELMECEQHKDVVEIFSRQYEDMSQKHGSHGRGFIITTICNPDGSVEVFSGFPSGRVKLTRGK